MVYRGVGYLLLMAAVFAAQGRTQNLDRSVTSFTAAVYQEVAKSHNNNILISPFSIQTLLSLLMSSSSGNTLQEMSRVLYLPQDTVSTSRFFSRLISKIQATPRSNRTKMLIANRLFARKHFRVSPEFRDIASQYDADIEQANFDNSVVAAEKINDWIARRTNNLIPTLVSSSDITPNTQLLLLNALYFHGQWARAFKPNNTRIGSFYSADNVPADVQLMNVRSRLRYADVGELNAQLVEIPYFGGDYSMVVVLPKRRDGLKDLEVQMPQVFDAARLELNTALVNLTLPKFHVEDKVDYREILMKLGMTDAFTNQARFSVGAEGEPISISKVLSKTFIDVTEKGTKAAAASAVGAVTLSIPPPVEKVTFTADHPFIFFIYTTNNNAPIFVGRVNRVEPVTQSDPPQAETETEDEE